MIPAVLVAAVALPSPASAHRVDGSRDHCHTQTCKTRVWHKHQRKVVAPYIDWLLRLGRCESGNRWWINTGNGYYGEFQFDAQTWRSVGGAGLPHQNSRLEQRYRAVILRSRRGTQPWPVCG